MRHFSGEQKQAESESWKGPRAGQSGVLGRLVLARVPTGSPPLVTQLLLNLKREGQSEGGGCCFILVLVFSPPPTRLSSAICSTLENVMKRVPSLRRLMQTTLISCCSFQSETKVSEKKKKEGFSPRIKLGVCPLHLSDSACKSISRFPCI